MWMCTERKGRNRDCHTVPPMVRVAVSWWPERPRAGGIFRPLARRAGTGVGGAGGPRPGEVPPWLGATACGPPCPWMWMRGRSTGKAASGGRGRSTLVHGEPHPSEPRCPTLPQASLRGPPGTSSCPPRHSSATLSACPSPSTWSCTGCRTWPSGDSPWEGRGLPLPGPTTSPADLGCPSCGGPAPGPQFCSVTPGPSRV